MPITLKLSVPALRGGSQALRQALHLTDKRAHYEAAATAAHYQAQADAAQMKATALDRPAVDADGYRILPDDALLRTWEILRRKSAYLVDQGAKWEYLQNETRRMMAEAEMLNRGIHQGGDQ